MSEGPSLESLFPSAEKPGRYSGGEWNSIRKDPSGIRYRIALAFPDVYEIGMSYLGQKILYDRLNSREDWQAERVFAPWPDMEAALRASGRPLFSIETRTPLAEFDLIGFSLLYELNYSNVLTMLDLAGLALLEADRPNAAPLVIAGGPAAFNPEPMAVFFDLFLIGDGEEAVPELIDRLTGLKARGASKIETLIEAAKVRGVYVPCLYEAQSHEGARFSIVRGRSGAPAAIRKRVLADFAVSPFPVKIVVPNVQTVFDRVAVEVARGCPQKCRFCQAASLYAPFRVKDPGLVVETVRGSLACTGYEDASLFALSVSDYPYLEETVRTLMAELEPGRTSLSLSALRPKGLSAAIAREITKVRKTGFTLVPEAGTDRLRRVINKDLTDEEMLTAAANALREGWRLFKLYVMIGLPTETPEDVEAIAGLAERLSDLGREIAGGAPRIHLSVSSFIPKPHTPFQWAAMEDPESLRGKQIELKRRLARRRNVIVKTHPVESSIVEACFSRGDRRLGNVLLRAWRKGARFDSWGDRFRFDFWREAFEEEGLDPQIFLRAIEPETPLPWEHIETGMAKDFLLREWDRSRKGETTPSCLDAACGDCRGCAFDGEIIKAFPPGRRPSPSGPPLRLGEPEDGIARYQAFYVKDGPLRFIGHNDLVNAIQRVFRRAGIEVVYSVGFHPKMRMTFLPPLALGMAGVEESLEFKSGFRFGEEEFLRRVNAAAPEGLRFIGLAALPPGARSFTDRIRGMDYAVALDAEGIPEALKSIRGTRGWNGLSDRETLERMLEETSSGAADPGGPEAVLDPAAGGLLLKFAFHPQKAPRPQDFVKRLFGLPHPARAIVRRRVRWGPFD